jgi:hypothetical protein
MLLVFKKCIMCCISHQLYFFIMSNTLLHAEWKQHLILTRIYLVLHWNRCKWQVAGVVVVDELTAAVTGTRKLKCCCSSGWFWCCSCCMQQSCSFTAVLWPYLKELCSDIRWTAYATFIMCACFEIVLSTVAYKESGNVAGLEVHKYEAATWCMVAPFLGPWYGTCFISSFWCQEFWRD